MAKPNLTTDNLFNANPCTLSGIDVVVVVVVVAAVAATAVHSLFDVRTRNKQARIIMAKPLPSPAV